MYTEEQSYVSQLHSHKNIVDKANQITLLQRNKSSSQLTNTQQNMRQQADKELKDDEKNEESVTTNEKFKLIEQILGVNKYLKGPI